MTPLDPKSKPTQHSALSTPNPLPDPLDNLIAAALRARPIPAPQINLAAEALSRAKTLQLQDARLAHLARLKRYTRLATLAAVLLLSATLALAYKFWPSYTDSTTTGAITSAYTPDLTTIGIAAFIITLIILALLMLFTPERPQIRLTPA